MRLLLTRPLPSLHASAARLRRLGFMPVACPSLRLVARAQACPPITAADMMAFTSAHAVRAFCDLAPPSSAFEAVVFAVGQATARAAKHAGFARIRVGTGGIAQLVPHIVAAHPKNLLHFVGAAGAQALSQRLRAQGITCTTYILYDAKPNLVLPPRVQHLLATRAIAAVLFYSAESARAFLRSVPHSLRLMLGTIPAICLSKAAARACQSKMRAYVAPEKNETSLLLLTQRVLAKG